MKKVVCLLLALTIALLNFGICFAISFSDVPANEWYNSYVYNLAEKQVINGYPDGTFRPKEKITVGQFLKLIIVASAGDKINFDLVKPEYENWASVYLTVAENYNVVKKGEYSEADLDRYITRIEIVRILSKCDLMIMGNSQKSSNKKFTDTNDLSIEDKVYLQQAVAIGVINGDPEGTFRPNDSLLRSECAKVIYTYTNRA